MLLAALFLSSTLAAAPSCGAHAHSALDDVAPTKRQRESLAILVTAWSDRLVTHAESLEKEDVERALRKALYNQVSYRAEPKMHDALVQLCMEDYGLKKSEGRRLVEREWMEAWRQAAIADSGGALNRHGFQSHHRSVLMHREDVLDELRRMHDGYDVDEDQEKALKTLAELYARRMISIVEEPGEKKRMIKLCEEALVTRNSDRALVSVRNKALGLLRRRAIGERKIKDDKEKLELTEEITEQLPQAFPETFWHELAFDHGRCLDDPEAHRKVLKDLIKGKRRPPEATPPPLEGAEEDPSEGELPGGG